MKDLDNSFLKIYPLFRFSVILSSEMEHMTDIVVVVDAQNGFCHPDGNKVKYSKTKADKEAIQETVRHIGDLLSEARDKRIPCIFLASNFNLIQTDFRWDTQIHGDLSPEETEKIFWRSNPNSDPFLDDPGDFVKSFPNPRLLLCGFWSDCCVERAALCALQRKIPVSFLVDCAYPPYGEEKQAFFLAAAKEKPWNIDDTSLIRFTTSRDILHELAPAKA